MTEPCDINMAAPDMESRFNFYSFSEYEFLISTIPFSLVKIQIIDIRN